MNVLNTPTNYKYKNFKKTLIKCLHCSPAVYSDGVIARLLLLFLHRSNYIDHALSISGDPHLWPTMEMKLTDSSSLVLLGAGRIYLYIYVVSSTYLTFKSKNALKMHLFPVSPCC